jgi:hypothetical protein
MVPVSIVPPSFRGEIPQPPKYSFTRASGTSSTAGCNHTTLLHNLFLLLYRRFKPSSAPGAHPFSIALLEFDLSLSGAPFGGDAHENLERYRSLI